MYALHGPVSGGKSQISREIIDSIINFFYNVARHSSMIIIILELLELASNCSPVDVDVVCDI